MIPTEVWENWLTILYDVVTLIMGNVLLSFSMSGVVIIMVVNLIIRLSSPKSED